MRPNRGRVTKLVLGLILSGLLLSRDGKAQDLFKIDRLKLVGESMLNQVVDHRLNIRWHYSHRAATYNVEIKIYQETDADQDTLIWQKELTELTETTFQIVNFGLLQDGNTYRLAIRARHPRLDWSPWRHLQFTMNSPPREVAFYSSPDTIFSGDQIDFRLIPAGDAQIATTDIIYEFKISSDSMGAEIIKSDLCSGQLRAPDTLSLSFPNDLSDNKRYFAFVRAYDQVEYSPWSEALAFRVNRREEPPEGLRLHAKGELGVVGDYPLLRWSAARDPEAPIGGGIVEYRVYIAADSQFHHIRETIQLSPQTLTYQPHNIRNHCKYFWRVIARDKAGRETVSSHTGHFVLNTGNIPPPAPILIAPKDQHILQPRDFLSWQQPSDEQPCDRLGFRVLITDSQGIDTLVSHYLSDTLVAAAQKIPMPGFMITYDNRFRLRLEQLDALSQLSDAQFYQFQVAVFDNWGDTTFSDWQNATFQYDDNINQPPQAPTKGFAPDGIIVNTYQPCFSWHPGFDADVGDRLRYEIILSRDKNFQSRTHIRMETKYGQNGITMQTPLLENSRYFWKVRSLDLYDKASPWSRVNYFWINTINEAPNGPVEPLRPPSLTEVAPDDYFWWLPVTDPDPGDQVRYHLEIATRPHFKDPLIQHTLDTLFRAATEQADKSLPAHSVGLILKNIPQLDRLQDNQLYYWRILARDNNGLQSPGPRRPPRIAYNSQNDPPLPVTRGFHPANGAIINSQQPTIQWTAVNDPDFRDFTYRLTYDLQLSLSANFESDSLRSYQTSPGESRLKIPEPLTENKSWYYRVRAMDEHGAASDWSLPQHLIINAFNEPPYTVSEGFLPKDSMLVDVLTPVLSWHTVSDPDPAQDEHDIHYLIRYVPAEYLGTSKEHKKSKVVKSKHHVNSLRLPPLAENIYYAYQIAAQDPDGERAPWSDWHIFGVNSIDEAPRSFSLLYPTYQSDSVAVSTAFSWQNTRDADPGNYINYTLYYSADSLFHSAVEKIDLEAPRGDTVVFQPMHPLQPARKYFWKVAAKDNTGLIRWGSNSDQHPFVFRTQGFQRALGKPAGANRFYLYQNSPNPFNEITRIRYEVAEYSNISMTIYNVLGKKIKTLTSAPHSAGTHETYWDGTDMYGNRVPGGMYLCQMRAKDYITHRKVVLLR